MKEDTLLVPFSEVQEIHPKKTFLFVLKCKKKGKEIIFLYQLETKSIHLFLFKKYLKIASLCSEPSVSFLLS